jgi:DNA repair ATPase RecN
MLLENGDAIWLQNRFVAGIKIRNLGPITDFELEFGEGINLVYGEPMSGKTIMRNIIAYTLGASPEKPCTVTYGRESGEAKVYVDDNARQSCLLGLIQWDPTKLTLLFNR